MQFLGDHSADNLLRQLSSLVRKLEVLRILYANLRHAASADEENQRNCKLWLIGHFSKGAPGNTRVLSDVITTGMFVLSGKTTDWKIARA